MKRKLISIFMIVLALALLVTAIFLISERVKKARLYRMAEELVADGQYETARDIFLSLGDPAMAEECTRLIRDRSYREACALADAGEYSRAIELFKMLEDYADSAAKLFDAQAALYLRALECIKGGQFTDALEVFSSLGEFQDSAEMARRCAARVSMSEGTDKKIMDGANLYGSFPTGKLYISGCGYVFIPNAPDDNTEFLLFFPGGRDIEEPLDYLYNYINVSSNNMIALFLYRNGLYDMEAKAQIALETLREAGEECGIALKAPLICGSSMGAYPALHSAAYYSRSLPIPQVICFDAGVDWEENELLLNENERAALGEAGTKLWLLEQYGVGTDRQGIADLVLSGCDVTMVYCENGEHNAILYNALDLGMIDLALGRRTALDTDNYTFIPLSAEDLIPEDGIIP